MVDGGTLMSASGTLTLDNTTQMDDGGTLTSTGGTLSIDGNT
jgi:hypothetical protein